MTLWELVACVDGVNAASGAEAPIEAPSDDDFDALLAADAERTRH